MIGLRRTEGLLPESGNVSSLEHANAPRPGPLPISQGKELHCCGPATMTAGIVDTTNEQRDAASEDATGQAQRLWLNVASSVDVLEGYVNIDNGFFYRITGLLPVLKLLPFDKYARSLEVHRSARTRARVLLHDCRRSLPFSPGTVHHVLCSHFLEHVYPEQALSIVRDFHRVLRIGGTVHLIVPNLRHYAGLYLDDSSVRAAGNFVEQTILSSRTRPSWRFRLLEALGYEGLKHRWMYDETSLQELAVAAGFRPASREVSPSFSYRAHDGPASAHFVGTKQA
jgi:predicted SAM-dependent methyltransferase